MRGAARELVGNRFVAAVISSASSGVGALALRLLSIALLSRLVAADTFGYYFLGQSVALIASAAGNLSASYKIMEAESLGSRDLLLGLAGPFTLTTLLLAVAGLGAEWAAPTYLLGLFGVTGLAVAASAPMMSALRSAEALGRRLLQFRHLAWSEIWATSAGFFVCAPALALAGYSDLALIAGHWVYVVTKFSLILSHNRGALPSVLTAGEAMPSKKGRLSAFGLEVLDLVSVHVVRLLVGAVFGQVVVALWSRASQLVLLAVNMLVQPIAYVLVPLGLRDRERRGHLAAHAPQLIDNLSLLLLPVAVTMFILSKEIALFLLGRSWLDAAAYMQAFSLLVIGRTVQRSFGILGRATQTSGLRLGIDAGAFAVFLIVSGAMLGEGSLLAAWAFSIASCFAACLHFVYGSAGTRIWPTRFLGAMTAYGLVCTGFSHSGGLSLSLGSKVAWAVSMWLLFGALCSTAAWVARPILSGGMLLEFSRRMDHRTIQ